ncbi:MAG: glycerol-3-phosphate responsive antiterminator [Clostridia bacterium]|nr:glycerol-3-phosphate responsive antiterminator [Clostridia bacterium]
MINKLLTKFEENPVIAAVRDSGKSAMNSPCEVIFDLGANIMTVASVINEAHRNGKLIFVHIDLAEGIGKDRGGLNYLKMLGSDGIISTKTGLLRQAKELSMLTVKRVFLLDSQGVESAMNEIDRNSTDLIEIMPGIMPKMVERFSRIGVPVIAGGLIETKAEITSSLSSGAVAVSTGKKELWYV